MSDWGYILITGLVLALLIGFSWAYHTRLDAMGYKLAACADERLAAEKRFLILQDQYERERAWLVLVRNTPVEMSGCMPIDEIKRGATLAARVRWRDKCLTDLTRAELVAALAFTADELKTVRSQIQGSMYMGQVSVHGGYAKQVLGGISAPPLGMLAGMGAMSASMQQAVQQLDTTTSRLDAQIEKMFKDQGL